MNRKHFVYRKQLTHEFIDKGESFYEKGCLKLINIYWEGKRLCQLTDVLWNLIKRDIAYYMMPLLRH